MNFLKGKLETIDGRLAFRADGGAALQLEGVADAAGQPVVYGIRPEHIEIGPGGLPAKVSVLEPTGSETQIFARIGSVAIDAVVKGRVDMRPGDEIALRIDPRAAHIFDGATGARL